MNLYITGNFLGTVNGGIYDPFQSLLTMWSIWPLDSGHFGLLVVNLPLLL